MQNAAQHALEDFLMFSWPLGVVVLRIALFDRGNDRLKLLELMVGGLGVLSLSFFLLDDGPLLLTIANAHPLWGAILVLTALFALLSIALSWRQTQSDNAELSRGVLDAHVTDIKLAGLRPRTFAATAAVLAVLAISWLFLIAKTATGRLS